MMRLVARIEAERFAVDVEDEMLRTAAPMFDRMDADMAGGRRMGMEFVENPNALERAQIVADKLMRAISAGNEATAMAMAAYLLDRMPGVVSVDINTTGDWHATEFQTSMTT